MKTLILMRHAKSSLAEKNTDDWDRPLSKRGRKNAVTMAKVLKEKEILPQVILASAAVRSHQTADLLVEELSFRGDIYYLASLYRGEVDTYLEAIRRLLDPADCVLVIGHNPVLESFLQMITGKVEALPTASLAYLQVPVNAWQELSLDTPAELVHFWKPKDEK